MLIAVEHLGKVGVGVTSPHFFRADDGNIYIVKLQNNRLGPKVLANEFLAAKLGEFLGLCFPPTDIIEINEQTLLQDPYLSESCISLGRHFASRYLDNSVYVDKDNLGKAVNIAEMAGVILFDHMFLNADRASKKNLLLRQEDTGYKIYAIDNSHLFQSGKWSAKSLNILGTKKKVFERYSFKTLLSDYLSPQDFLPYLGKIEKISDEQIDKLVHEIPAEWLPDEAERQALAHFIKLRRNMAEQIWEKLCRHIPKVHGGLRRLQGKTIRPWRNYN